MWVRGSKGSLRGVQSDGGVIDPDEEMDEVPSGPLGGASNGLRYRKSVIRSGIYATSQTHGFFPGGDAALILLTHKSLLCIGKCAIHLRSWDGGPR
jgi:hypothetical protein